MGQRHRARELAVQFLYQLEATGQSLSSGLEQGLENFKAAFGLPKKPAAYFARLVSGVAVDQADLDALIEANSHHWRVERMTFVDRNILRLAVFEMLNIEDVPAKVAINEAVELAKDFGSDESPKFINGVLDAVAGGLKTK